ncbi:MAG: hypothetical protein ABI740_02265 [Alphaproteobacteria bacterium]
MALMKRRQPEFPKLVEAFWCDQLELVCGGLCAIGSVDAEEQADAWRRNVQCGARLAHAQPVIAHGSDASRSPTTKSRNAFEAAIVGYLREFMQRADIKRSMDAMRQPRTDAGNGLKRLLRRPSFRRPLELNGLPLEMISEIAATDRWQGEKAPDTSMLHNFGERLWKAFDRLSGAPIVSDPKACIALVPEKVRHRRNSQAIGKLASSIRLCTQPSFSGRRSRRAG